MLDALKTIQVNNAELEARYAPKLITNRRLNRQLVSFQANKNQPGYRWFKYKEGFSEALILYLLDYLKIDQGRLLDPFAGTGTTLFAASESALDTVGIELLPVGVEIMEVRRLVKEHTAKLIAVVDRWRREKPWQTEKTRKLFRHLRITQGAFPEATQEAIEKYFAALEAEDEIAARVLRFSAMCVLESVSYTRKDGQYLRWDYRSSRRQGKKPFDKGQILAFDDAIEAKLEEIYADLQPNKGMLEMFPLPEVEGEIQILQGSCLDVLPGLPSTSFDGIITSPPYANRYDYTRTYALELAMLGVDEDEIRRLRQEMVSCTVENREKVGLEHRFTPDQYRRAFAAFEGQSELNNILEYLEWQKNIKALNNAGIPRMLRNYFLELSLVIFECARLLKPGVPFVMVNDNVRYGGATIPVDLILSDFAEQAGFEVEVIWVVPTEKGNSSQQMGVHGREALRKCIYIWRRKGA